MKFNTFFLRISVIFLFVFLFVSKGYALPLTITATADNSVFVYYPNTMSQWYFLSGYWQSSRWMNLDYSGGYIYFAGLNAGSPSPYNPAGFLGQIEVSGELILSSPSWELTVVPMWSGTPAFDADDLSGFEWVSADWYATNDGQINPIHPEADGANINGLSLWIDGLRHPIYGISNDAMWIWSNKNFSEDMDNGVVLRVNPWDMDSNVSNVPEPVSMALFGLGMFGIIVGRRKKEIL